jgi:multiple sugar transport system substrate-binding protein
VRSHRVAALVGTAVLVTGLLAGCTSGNPNDEDPTPIIPTKLTFGVFGPPEELKAYRQIVDKWNLDEPGQQVTLSSVGSRDEQIRQIKSGAPVPDVFLVSRRDLAYLMQSDLTQPVGELLDQPGRDVDFGDGYPIDAVRAFAGSNDLQCMPYGYSPMVMYYNKDLVDFDRMARRGLNVPSQPGGWSFDEFAEAARFASRPATRAAGVYIDPTLRALSPFIYSGGGKVFDDPDNPTSLDLSDGDTRAALGTTLELLRNPLVTLSDKQLSKQSALDWFKEGKLGMIAGFRSLTPELRKVPGLNFDVMAMPNLGDEKTVGDVTGLCMSKAVQDPEAAADFIYYLSSDPAVSKVTAAGYLVPANLEVAASVTFLQPGQRPETSSVFNSSIRDIVLPPVLDVYPELEAAVSNDLRRMFSVPLLDLTALTEQIDADSKPVLEPESASPSASP